MVDISQISGKETRTRILTPEMCERFWVVPEVTANHSRETPESRDLTMRIPVQSNFRMISRDSNDYIDFLYYAGYNLRMIDSPLPFIHNIFRGGALTGFYVEGLMRPSIEDQAVAEILGYPYISLGDEKKPEVGELRELLTMNRIPYLGFVSEEDIRNSPLFTATLNAIRLVGPPLCDQEIMKETPVKIRKYKKAL
ncbi:MAG: hypothetical protein AABX23_04040 [Nanoarchaeota archaeon]